MSSDILKQIDNIDKNLRWIEKYRPEHYEQRFLQLVEERRKLRKIAEAEQDNPAIAAYGKSQVGKSYLMSNMLQQEVVLPDGQKTIKPFEVEADGKRYNFINDMNPIVNNVEATGVVTRFSSFSRDEMRFSERYPVLMRSLSAADMILILCDGYYNDVQDYTTDSRTEIDERAEALYRCYINRDRQLITPITADDVLEMKFYFRKYINNAQEFNHSEFFNKLALVINRIPMDDYVEIFSYLWHEDQYLTPLCRKLLLALARLNFHRDIYLSVDAVLHRGINENTIMSVQCLDGLGDSQGQFFCDAYLKQTDGTFQKIPQMNKSELSAVCAEVVYHISSDFLESTASYDMTHIADPKVRAQLTQGELKLDLLKRTDLLDFPGARSRKKEGSATLQQSKILTTVLLRGKVAYLFNKYSESKVVNILLYCHDYEMNDVTSLYITLNEWVHQYVGQTYEERAKTLQLTGNISPLFYIATKFNVDMAESQNPSANERNAVDGRWGSRFMKVLYKECFNADSVDWVRNWTRPGQFFQNSYLLRDFKYSGIKGSKLFGGFPETGKEQNQLVSDEYMQLLRDSFCENKEAGLFFSNRELSWDVATTMNNDGALYIIENLTRVASAMGNVRTMQFSDACSQAIGRVYAIMKEYYIPDDTAELLLQNLRKANGIFREIEFTCQSQPEYFGHLLQALQLTEAESFKEVHRIIPTLTATVNDSSLIKDYELIRKRCGNFADCSTEAEKWEVFVSRYRFTDQNEASEYLRAKNIDVEKLFKGETLKRRNSAVISNEIMTLWQKRISSVQFLNAYAGGSLIDEIAMTNLVSCLVSTAQNLQLSERLEKEIADYVNVLNISSINEDLIADMIATTISDFVMDFGYRYLSEEQIQTSLRISNERHLPCFNWTGKERKEHFDESEMEVLFNDILSSSEHYTPAYTANYNSWLEFMFVAFIAHINVPDFDRAANEELKELLDTINK